jgi:hypothetical protein
MLKNTSQLVKELEKHGLANRGTDLGGLLQWAMLHIQSQDEALAELERELLCAIQDRDAAIKALDFARIAHSAMDEALRCDALINPYQTCAADFTSHVNIMMANGVEPYAKKPRKKKNETK